jgi:hypothetical protein
VPREYGQLRHDIWNDDDFRSLTLPAQWLYMVLVSDPKLNYCGVTSWHAGKIAQRSAETSPKDVLLAALELCEKFYTVIDEDTEEVFIRSYLKHDGLLKNPRLSVTMTKDYGSIGSNKIRAALVYEPDPELRYTQGGLAVANFTIASTPRIFDKTRNEYVDGEALFLRASCWRDFAEHVAGSLTKGSRVIATGRLKQRSYDDRDGNKRTAIELEVDEIGPSLRYATATVRGIPHLRSAGVVLGRPRSEIPHQHGP